MDEKGGRGGVNPSEECRVDRGGSSGFSAILREKKKSKKSTFFALKATLDTLAVPTNLSSTKYPVLAYFDPPTPPVHHTACGHPPSHRSGPATRTTPPPLHPSHLLFYILSFLLCFYLLFCYSRFAQSPVNVSRPPLLENSLQSVPPAGAVFTRKSPKIGSFWTPHPGVKNRAFSRIFGKKRFLRRFKRRENPFFSNFPEKSEIFGGNGGGQFWPKIAFFSDPVMGRAPTKPVQEGFRHNSAATVT